MSHQEGQRFISKWGSY